MSLVDRAKNILLSPKTEWDVIRAEPATVGSLFTGYAAILALIPAIAGFLGSVILGPMGMVGGFIGGVLGYVLGLVGLYIYGVVLNAIAPSFGALSDPVQAMKVGVYSSTALWVGGILKIIPVVGDWLALLVGLYVIYLTYLGIQNVLYTPQDKAIGFTAVAAIIYIVIFAVIFGVTLLVAGLFAVGAMAANGAFSGM